MMGPMLALGLRRQQWRRPGRPPCRNRQGGGAVGGDGVIFFAVIHATINRLAPRRVKWRRAKESAARTRFPTLLCERSHKRRRPSAAARAGMIYAPFSGARSSGKNAASWGRIRWAAIIRPFADLNVADREKRAADPRTETGRDGGSTLTRPPFWARLSRKVLDVEKFPGSAGRRDNPRFNRQPPGAVFLRSS